MASGQFKYTVRLEEADIFNLTESYVHINQGRHYYEGKIRAKFAYFHLNDWNEVSNSSNLLNISVALNDETAKQKGIWKVNEPNSSKLLSDRYEIDS